MAAQLSTIGPLTKAKLTLKVVPINAADDTSAPEADFEFIYGIGTSGITPFEKALFGKSPGDCVTINVTDNQSGTLLGHLQCDLLGAVQTAPPFGLQVIIQSLAAADSREVVKALAQLGGCDSDCGCGCGC